MELGEILKYKKGKAPNSHRVGSDYVIYLSPEYLRGKATATLIPDFLGKVEVNENDLLLLWDGSNAGEFFLAKKGVLSSTMVKLLFDEERIDKSFFYYQLKFIEDFLKSQTNGSGIPHVDKEILLTIKVEKFHQSEQRQIATILSKVDEAISQTEKLIAKYSRIKTGLMQDLLTKGIDEHGNIRSEETHQFKDSPLGRIPVEWEIEKLSKLAEINSGLTLGKDYPESGTKEMPYLRVANVQDGYLDLSEIKYIRVPVAQVSKYKLEVGDVLMNEGGDFDKLGRGTVWEGQIPNCLHQNHVFKVRLNQEEMLPEFLSVYSASNFGKTFFILSSKQSTNLASINKSQLKEFPILKPELTEQHRILNAIKSQALILEATNSSLSKLQAIKSGLMQDLLSGKVRVNHLFKEMVSA